MLHDENYKRLFASKLMVEHLLRDTVWRLRLGEHWVYLLILLEFQSEDDPWMALRIHAY